MHLRPKTVRRLLVLGLVLLVMGGAAAGVWAVQARKSAARVAKARHDAMAAYQREDFKAALPHFSAYLTESKTAAKGPDEADTEALFAYGKSRRAIPMKNARHLVEAINIFERYRELRPNDRDAQHELLELYPSVKYDEEALKLAKHVLAEDANDIHALRATVMAFANQRKFPDALEVAERLTKLLPGDLKAHQWTHDLMFAMQKPSDEIIARFTKLLDANPGDPRFELLLARAHTFANHEEEAKRLLKAAAARKPTDPEVATALSRLLEKYRLFNESNRVLEQLAQDEDDALHVRPLVRRMWQGGRYKEVVRRTDKLDPAAPTSDTELLAYRALSLYDLNRPADAAPIVAALASRQDDMAAAAWSTALVARENENLAPRDRVKQYEAALERTPDNEVIHFFLGEAYVGVGETEPALRKWKEAFHRAPGWAAPAAAIARTLAMTGRSAEALAFARAAFQRAPGALSTTTGLVVATFADQQQNPDPEARKQLLRIVERLQEEVENEPETLHIYAALLSRTGDRDKAVAVIKSALSPDKPAPRDTLLQLAAVSFSEKLGLESEILDFAAKTHGRTPAVAVRQALLLAQAGKPQDGLRLLESAAANDVTTDPTLWSVALLQYRENTGDEAVLADWMRLGEANPDNARVQQAILRSPSRLADKTFWLSTIDRLKKLAGDDAVTPRVERARWLLHGDSSEQQASQAIRLLREVDAEVTSLPEIRRLLGLAHEKNAAFQSDAQRRVLLETAAAELNRAFDAGNADPAVATDLTRVYRALGRNDDADRVMSRVAERASDLGIDGRKRTARTLVAQGQLRKAIEVLEPIGDGQDVGRDALLCSLYRRAGETDKAAGLYMKMLEDHRVEPASLAEGADFFAAAGKPDEAEQFLARLRSMEGVPPARRQLLQAQFAERHQPSGQAREAYEAAVAADPSYAAAWRGLVGFHLRTLAFADAAAAADRGLKALPDDTDLRSLRTRAAALLAYKNDPNIGTLTDELAADPQSRPIAELLQILGDAQRNKEPLAQTLPKLRKLADANPDLLRLQMYVAQAHAKLRQFDEAEQVATRAAARAPNDPEAARLLTSVYAARPGQQKWGRVLDAARQWRLRSLDNPLPADTAIAQALLAMGQASEAAEQLAAHVASPVRPEANPAPVGTYARALVRSGRTPEAADLLTPLAKAGPTWRKVWLEIGATAYDNAEDAIAWVDRVVPMLGDNIGERAALAETWLAIGSQFSSDAALGKAKAVIEPLTSGKDAGVTGWQLLAALSEVTGNRDQALQANRKLLALSPENADYQNNLAYALLEAGRSEDLPEAQALAERAVERAPTNSTYLDTLARVYRSSRDLPKAEQTFRRALEAEPGSVEAMIGLADVRARAGHQAESRELLTRIQNAIQREGTVLPKSLQEELESVRQSVKASVSSAHGQ